ncbi:MAG: FHA domain-containing protein [Chthoniobacterales bacterium]
MACLVVTREEADLVTHELTRDIVTIGSAPLNHIVIDDPAVSAQHAILARVADSYWLKDLGSTNGTHVNGVSISDAELKNGDKIQFGTVPSMFATSRKKPPQQISSSPAGPLILPVPAQADRESSTAMAQISPPRPRKSIRIAVAIAVLMIVGGAGWYFGHKRAVAPEKLSGSVQTERQIPIVNPTEAEAAIKQREPMATRPQRKADKDLTVLPMEDVARPQQPQQEVGPKKEFPVSNSPTIAQPSIAPASGPWLFPDSSSRYLSATDLSSLSSADLWRARNEIFARKGYKFSTPRGIAFAQTLGNHYRGVDDDQGRVFNNMNQYERANLTLIRAIEKGR